MKSIDKVINDLLYTSMGEPLVYKDKMTKIKEKFNLYHGKGKRKKRKKKK